MNLSVHYPLRFELLPRKTSNTGLPPVNLYVLRMQYKEGGHFYEYPCTYLVPDAAKLIASGEVSGVSLSTVKLRGLAQRQLPGGPDYVVMGVELRDGTRISTLPPVYRRTVARYAAIGVLAGLGGALLVNDHAVCGLLLFALGTHFVRSAFEIPIKPFWF